MLFWPVFWKNCLLRRNFFHKIGSLYYFGRARSEKKGRQNFLKIFWKTALPRKFFAHTTDYHSLCLKWSIVVLKEENLYEPYSKTWEWNRLKLFMEIYENHLVIVKTMLSNWTKKYSLGSKNYCEWLFARYWQPSPSNQIWFKQIKPMVEQVAQNFMSTFIRKITFKIIHFFLQNRVAFSAVSDYRTMHTRQKLTN